MDGRTVAGSVRSIHARLPEGHGTSKGVLRIPRNRLQHHHTTAGAGTALSVRRGDRRLQKLVPLFPTESADPETHGNQKSRRIGGTLPPIPLSGFLVPGYRGEPENQNRSRRRATRRVPSGGHAE